MSIPSTVIDIIKSKADIVEVIGDYVALKKEGQKTTRGSALSIVTNHLRSQSAQTKVSTSAFLVERLATWLSFLRLTSISHFLRL